MRSASSPRRDQRYAFERSPSVGNCERRRRRGPSRRSASAPFAKISPKHFGSCGRRRARSRSSPSPTVLKTPVDDGDERAVRAREVRRVVLADLDQVGLVRVVGRAARVATRWCSASASPSSPAAKSESLERRLPRVRLVGLRERVCGSPLAASATGTRQARGEQDRRGRPPLTARSSYARTVARLVGEVRAQPALGLVERDALPGGVVLDLVAPDPADREVARLRVREVDAADARRRGRREGLGQLEARARRRRAARRASPSRCGRDRPGSRTPAGSRGSAPRSAPRSRAPRPARTTPRRASACSHSANASASRSASALTMIER